MSIIKASCLRMFNYNNNKKFSFNCASYSSKNINRHEKVSPVEDEDIRIIGTIPATSRSFFINCQTYRNYTSGWLKKQFDFQYLNSTNKFLLFLVIYFVGSQFKILRMAWYKCMTTFRDNLQLFMNKYLCQ